MLVLCVITSVLLLFALAFGLEEQFMGSPCVVGPVHPPAAPVALDGPAPRSLDDNAESGIYPDEAYVHEELMRNGNLVYFFKPRKIPEATPWDIAWESDMLIELFAECTCRSVLLIATAEGNGEEIYDYELVEQFAKQTCPSIIMLISDEFGTLGHYNHLAKYCSLLCRTHYFSHYPMYPNVLHVPLAYTTGFMERDYQGKVLRSAQEREYAWVFVGSIKNDRQEMIDSFTHTFGNDCPHKIGSLERPETREIYRNSVFAPNGRGNVVLACYRLYEASACGAIPVVVGSEQEIQDNFLPDENPPWIFARSWHSAADQAYNLWMDVSALETRRRAVEHWYKARIRNVQRAIADVCSTGQPPN